MIRPLRVLKSGLIIAKVMSLSMLCKTSPAKPAVLCSVLVLAILDFWWPDRLAVSTALGAMHLGLLSLGRERCCLYEGLGLELRL